MRAIMPFSLIFALAGCSQLPMDLHSLTPPQALVAPAAPTAPAAPAALVAAPQADLNALATLPDVAERVVKSVVNISTSRKVANRPTPFSSDPFFQQFLGRGRQAPERQERSLGSGVIVRGEGVVLTNNHVVEGADAIEVALSDGRTFKAKVINTDPQSDLAVIRLEDPPADLTPLDFGDSSTLRLGEVVLAVGDPFGVGQTVTMGIVSAKGRANLGIVDYEDFIQTDAAINPGNSGGALVSLRGELVGINTAIYSRSGGYQGVGFAIPSNMAKGILDQILDGGKVDRGFLGVSIQDVNEDLAAAMELPVEKGVLIGDVTEDGPAQKAGFQRGDVVTTFNGQTVDNANTFRMAVATAGSNKEFTATVLRDGKTEDLSGTLGSLADAQAETAVDSGSPLEGLSVGALDASLRQQLGLPSRVQAGVVVREVAPDSAAAKSGLAEGDVILEVNKRAVNSPASFGAAVREGGDRLLLLVWRDGSTVYLALRR